MTNLAVGVRTSRAAVLASAVVTCLVVGTASLVGDRLEIDSNGDRSFDYQIHPDPSSAFARSDLDSRMHTEGERPR